MPAMSVLITIKGKYLGPTASQSVHTSVNNAPLSPPTWSRAWSRLMIIMTGGGQTAGQIVHNSGSDL